MKLNCQASRKVKAVRGSRRDMLRWAYIVGAENAAPENARLENDGLKNGLYFTHV